MKKEKWIKHMMNGGQAVRTVTTPRRKPQVYTTLPNLKPRKCRFFYKIENGELLCRVNEMGGWYPAVAPPRWETDVLEAASVDWDLVSFPLSVTTIKLPTLAETTNDH